MRQAVVLAMAAGALLAPGTASAKKNCDDGSPWFEFDNSLVKRVPTDLHSDWVRGPGRVSLYKGRSGTSSVSMGQESGGLSLEIDWKLIKTGWNEGHSDQQITKSVSHTVAQEVSYRIPRGKVGRVLMKKAKLVTTAIKYKSGPGCRPVEVGRARVAAPLSGTQFIFVRQFIDNA